MTLRFGERWATFGATATGFLVLVAHALLETARDALFLAHVPAERLPWVYLVLAFAGLSVSEATVRSGARLDARRLLIVTQAIAAGGTLALTALVDPSTVVSYYVLYIWVGVASMSVLVRYWQHVSGCFTATRAKRLFPVIGAGSIAGALVGYALAEVLARSVGVRASIPVAAAFFAASMLGPIVFFARAREGAKRAEKDEEPSIGAGVVSKLRLIASDDYLRRLATILVVASMTVTLADFVFKSVVAREVAAGDMGSFFARTYFSFNVASLLILLLVVNPVLRRIGVPATLVVLPAALLAGTIGVIATGGLAAAVALKAADGALRWSTHKTVIELLYVPLPRMVRDAVKGVLDVVAHRIGQVAASLLLLVLLAATDSVLVAALCVGALAAVWIAISVTLREQYLDLFRATLARGPDYSALDFPDLDVSSLETLVAALNSPVDGKVVAALDLLEQKGRAHLVPALVLYHPSPLVVVRALDLFARARRKDVLPLLARVAEHQDAEVRAAALRTSTALRPDEALLRAALEHYCPVVNVTAIVGLTVGGWVSVERGVEDLLRHAETDSQYVLPMIARAIRYQPWVAFAPVLERLARDPDPETRKQAVLAMQAANDARFIPTLLAALGERALREDAREALVALGKPALVALDTALADHATPSALRVHIPQTIARFASQSAADVLARHLVAEWSGVVRYKVLRGLGRMCANDPPPRLDARALDEVIARMLEAMFRRLHWQATLAAGAEERPERRTPGHELLVQLLRDKEGLAVERLFRVLGLRYRGEAWADVYDGITSEDPIVKSSGVELLESAIPADLGRAVVALITEESLEARLDAGGAFYVPEPLTYDELIERLGAERGETLRLIARYHAVEIGLRRGPADLLVPVADEGAWVGPLRELAERMQRTMPGVTREAVEHG